MAAPDAVAALQPAPVAPTSTAPDATSRALIARVGAPSGSELERLLEVRVPELVAYQSAAYATRYVAFVAEVRDRAGDGAIVEAVARMHFKLLAYKDEYEVARLHLDAAEQAKIGAEHGEGATVKFHLHPPMLRALGMEEKLELGEWFVPAFKGLARLKRLRGTKLDPFGRAEVRRVERALPGEYEAAVRRALAQLTPATAPLVAELAASPDTVRGYEDIKLANVARWRAQLAALEARIAEGGTPAREAVLRAAVHPRALTPARRPGDPGGSGPRDPSCGSRMPEPKPLADLVAPGLRLLLVGINPSLLSAEVGHHFARPGNRFWPALHLAGITPRRLQPAEQEELLALGIGITNLCARPTRRADELSPGELLAGALALEQLVAELQPGVVAMVGITAYRAGFGRPKAALGEQPERLAGRPLWVLPNPSGLNAHHRVEDLARHYASAWAASAQGGPPTCR